LDCYVKAWDESICMSKRVYELWMMSLDKSWHVISIKWLVSKWHGIGMRWNSIFMDWEWWVGMDSTSNMNEDLVIKVGMKVMCMINLSWLIEYNWSMSVRNSLESLGEISGSCFSDRDVIPWPLLVGVHGGAPSI